MQQQRYYQIDHMLKKAFQIAHFAPIYNQELIAQVENSRYDLENAALEYSNILQKRSEITRNNIKKFIESNRIMTNTRMTLLKSAGLIT